MALQELMAVVVPPVAPKETGSVKAWVAAERLVGTPLPGDYRDFVMRYGSGTFNDPGRLCIFPRNPLSPQFAEQLRADCESLKQMKDILGDEEIPFAVFPESPGLLLWADDDNGNMLFWLTEGAPDVWPIMLYPRSGQGFERLEMSTTSFLARVFSRRLVCSAWRHPEFFSGPRKIKYATDQQDIEYR